MSEPVEIETTERTLDLNLLLRRNKFLLLFFVGAFVGLVGLLMVDGDAHFDGEAPSLVFKAFVGLAIISALGYLILLGKMAVQLEKNAFAWCFLTVLFYVFGFVMSYLKMQKEVRAAEAASSKSGQA